MPRRNQDEQEPVRAVARLFALQLLAVVAIATVITVVATLVAGDDQGTLTTTLPGDSETTTSATSPEPSPSPPPSSEQPASTPPPSPSAPETPSESATPSETTTSSGTTAKRLRVDVLNQSAGAGVAEATAERLRERGWRIGRVDDFSGTVRTTTVYYPANRRGQARLLAEDLPGSPRLLERFSTLSDSRLSVVLVD